MSSYSEMLKVCRPWKSLLWVKSVCPHPSSCVKVLTSGWVMTSKTSGKWQNSIGGACIRLLGQCSESHSLLSSMKEHRAKAGKTCPLSGAKSARVPPLGLKVSCLSASGWLGFLFLRHTLTIGSGQGLTDIKVQVKSPHVVCTVAFYCFMI